MIHNSWVMMYHDLTCLTMIMADGAPAGYPLGDLPLAQPLRGHEPPPLSARGTPKTGAWETGAPDTETMRQGQFTSPWTGQALGLGRWGRWRGTAWWDPGILWHLVAILAFDLWIFVAILFYFELFWWLLGVGSWVFNCCHQWYCVARFCQRLLS